MLTNPRHWTLHFDGQAFHLAPRSEAARAPVGRRVIEEGLETILFHWGDQLLPGPRLYMLGRSTTIVRMQDLLAVDDLGRIHIFELKKDRADAPSLFQLVSYLVQRPQDEARWLQLGVTNTLWYGEWAAACKLAGLVARQRIETLGAGQPGARPRYGERLSAILAQVVDIASERAGLDLTPDLFRQIAALYMEEAFGGHWAGSFDDPASVFGEVATARLPNPWRVGLTTPRITTWMVAPDIRGALAAAKPLIERELEIRCVSVDAREVAPGREWGITIAQPEDHASDWALADAFAHLFRAVLDRHLEACPYAADEVVLELQSASAPWTSESGSARLGWRCAANAFVTLHVTPDRVVRGLYYDWWTEGQARKMRAPIFRLAKEIRQRHPASWPWSPLDRDAAVNRQFVEGAAKLASDFWRGLYEIGAFDVPIWAYFMPPD